MVDVVIGDNPIQVVIVNPGDADGDGVIDPAFIELFRGPAGPQGPAGAGTFVHVQSTPAATWTITHGLNKKPTALLVVGGRQEYTDVEYASLDVIVITWPVATSGEAHLT